jgi:regulator of replication initiation timing
MFQRIWDSVLYEIENGQARHYLIELAKKHEEQHGNRNVKSRLQYKEDIIRLYQNIYHSQKEKYFLVDIYPHLKDRFRNVTTDFERKYL